MEVAKVSQAQNQNFSAKMSRGQIKLHDKLIKQPTQDDVSNGYDNAIKVIGQRAKINLALIFGSGSEIRTYDLPGMNRVL